MVNCILMRNAGIIIGVAIQAHDQSRSFMTDVVVSLSAFVQLTERAIAYVGHFTYTETHRRKTRKIKKTALSHIVN